jgi:hypothetical protein
MTPEERFANHRTDLARSESVDSTRFEYVTKRVQEILAMRINDQIGEDAEGWELCDAAIRAVDIADQIEAKHKLFNWLRDNAAARAGREFDRRIELYKQFDPSIYTAIADEARRTCSSMRANIVAFKRGYDDAKNGNHANPFNHDGDNGVRFRAWIEGYRCFRAESELTRSRVGEGLCETKKGGVQ